MKPHLWLRDNPPIEGREGKRSRSYHEKEKSHRKFHLRLTFCHSTVIIDFEKIRKFGSWDGIDIRLKGGKDSLYEEMKKFTWHSSSTIGLSLERWISRRKQRLFSQVSGLKYIFSQVSALSWNMWTLFHTSQWKSQPLTLNCVDRKQNPRRD